MAVSVQMHTESCKCSRYTDMEYFKLELEQVVRKLCKCLIRI